MTESTKLLHLVPGQLWVWSPRNFHVPTKLRLLAVIGVDTWPNARHGALVYDFCHDTVRYETADEIEVFYELLA